MRLECLKNICMSKLCRLVVGLACFFTCPDGIHAQTEQTEICIDFRVNSKTIDSTYMDNAARLDEIMHLLDELRRDSSLSISRITFSGVASPEGNSQINQRLATGRMEALEDYVRSHISLPDSLVVFHDDHYIPWQYLESQVLSSTDIPHKQEVLDILRLPRSYVPYQGGTTIDSRVVALQKLAGGSVWSLLKRRFFNKMRNACVVMVTLKKEAKPEPLPEPMPEPVEPEPLPVDTPAVSEEMVPEDVIVYYTDSEPEEDGWTRRLHVKTNAVGWGLLIANAAVEVDLAKHWSATLPVYYSAVNYFKSDVKLRTLCFQPEVRYWLDENHRGWFGGVHFGLAWFNYAKGEDWRYQDHNGNTPLWGGGISAGYRMPIFGNDRWWLECSLGTGVYKLHYDIFHNEYDGPHVDVEKKTFFGIDQVNVSLAYRFNLERKKGGKR